MGVVEVQERLCCLARQGLLTSHVGNEWSTPMLRARLLGRWVKFSGWLFYGADHISKVGRSTRCIPWSMKASSENDKEPHVVLVPQTARLTGSTSTEFHSG